MDVLKLTIVYMGLISQIGLDTEDKQRAVYVKSTDPPHEVRLRVPTAAIDPSLKPMMTEVTANCPTGYRCFALDQWRLALSGVPGGKTILDPTFTDHVPRLSVVTRPKSTNVQQALKPAIAKGDPHSAITGSLKYAGGKLRVDTTWCTQVQFKFSDGTTGEPMCAAHHVIYETQPDGKWVELLSKSGKTAIRIDAAATISIDNLPTSNPTKRHYHHHSHILDNVGDVGIMQKTGGSCENVPTNGTCIKGTPGPRRVLSLVDIRGVDYECTGSQWP